MASEKTKMANNRNPAVPEAEAMVEAAEPEAMVEVVGLGAMAEATAELQRPSAGCGNNYRPYAIQLVRLCMY